MKVVITAELTSKQTELIFKRNIVNAIESITKYIQKRMNRHKGTRNLIDYYITD